MAAAAPLSLEVQDARHSCASSEWYTPFEIVAAARALLGEIELDPASCAAANTVVGARHIHTIETDGLAQDWGGAVFLNPPSPAKPWWTKLMREHRFGGVSRAIYVAYSIEQVQQSQVWAEKSGQPHMLSFPVCFPKRRIRFYAPDGKGDVVPGASPTHASAIVGVGIDPRRFATSFRSLGACCT